MRDEVYEPKNRRVSRHAFLAAGPSPLVSLLLLVVLAGCKPPTSPVFVDLDAVVADETAPTPKPIPIPNPPRAMPPVTIVQPGRPAVALRDPSTSSAGDVRRAIDLQQQRDYERLVKRLTDFYEADALRFEQEQLREQGTKTDQAYQNALSRIRAVFEEYAKRRAPVIADLTIIVGFPDPNPTSTPPRQPMNKARRHYFDEAKTLRAQLKSIDATYDSQAQAIVNSVGADVAAAIGEINDRVHRYRLANDIKAEREAAQQVRQTARALGLRLSEPLRISLPAVPSIPVTIPGAPAPAPAPVVTSTGVLSKPADRRLLAEHELKIWLGQNRFVLSRKKPGVPDRTAEFETWRNQRTVGR